MGSPVAPVSASQILRQAFNDTVLRAGAGVRHRRIQGVLAATWPAQLFNDSAMSFPIVGGLPTCPCSG